MIGEEERRFSWPFGVKQPTNAGITYTDLLSSKGPVLDDPMGQEVPTENLECKIAKLCTPLFLLSTYFDSSFPISAFPEENPLHIHLRKSELI